MRTLPIHYMTICLLALPLLASTHYVSSNAKGKNDGSNWTDAWHELPATFVRGDTYYVAAGTYRGHVFNTPSAGEAVITIKAPSASDHGTDIGWQTAYQAQAVFVGQLLFTTGYWIFDGSYRGKWNDGSSYGFQVKNNDGHNNPLDAVAAICTGSTSNPCNSGGHDGPSHIAIKYIDVNGSHDRTGKYDDRGIWSLGGSHMYYGCNHIHDTGGVALIFDTLQAAVVEYNWIERNQSTLSHHAEGIAARPGKRGGINDLTIRYNYLENLEGTAVIATPVSDDSVNQNWYIYGNVLFFNKSESTGQNSVGDGSIDLFGNATWNNVYISNNTIANFPAGSPAAISIGAGWKTIVNRAVIQNNLWYQTDLGYPRGPIRGGACNQCTVSHNAFFRTANDGDTDPTKYSSGGNPFVNVGNDLGANDFHLTIKAVATMVGGTSLADTNGQTFGLDLEGSSRIARGKWVRGALECVSETKLKLPRHRENAQQRGKRAISVTNSDGVSTNIDRLGH